MTAPPPPPPPQCNNDNNNANANSNPRRVNYASLRRGAFSYYDTAHADPHRDAPLREDNWEDDGYTTCPPGVIYTIELLEPYLINTFVVWVWEKDNRKYIFDQFETSENGVTWQALLPPGTEHRTTFKKKFPARRVQYIRMRSSTLHLHLTRFQAYLLQ